MTIKPWQERCAGSPMHPSAPAAWRLMMQEIDELRAPDAWQRMEQEIARLNGLLKANKQTIKDLIEALWEIDWSDDTEWQAALARKAIREATGETA